MHIPVYKYTGKGEKLGFNITTIINLAFNM